MHRFVAAVLSLIVLCSAAEHDGRQSKSAQAPAAAPRSAAPQASPAAYSASYPGYYDNSFWKVNPYSANPGAPEPWRPYNYFRILRQYSNSFPNGYQFSYNTENQIQAAEEGEVPEYDPDENIGTSSRGYYQYVGDDGQTRRVDWTADENGFRPIVTIIPNYQFSVDNIARSSGAEEFPLGGVPLPPRTPVAGGKGVQYQNSPKNGAPPPQGQFGQN